MTKGKVEKNLTETEQAIKLIENQIHEKYKQFDKIRTELKKLTLIEAILKRNNP